MLRAPTLLALLALGCAEGGLPGEPAAPCESQMDCTSTETCVDNVCIPRGDPSWPDAGWEGPPRIDAGPTTLLRDASARDAAPPAPDAGPLVCAPGLADCDGLRANGCEVVVPPAPTASGAFAGGTAFGGEFVTSVTGSGARITFNGAAMGIDLGGATAAGTYTASARWLSSFTASGSTVTFADAVGGMGAITLTGAIASGSGTAPEVCGGRIGCFPGYFRSVSAAGSTITFTDHTGAAHLLTLIAPEPCAATP